VNLLIENNVLAPFNLPSSRKNPLLCVSADECLELIHEISHPRLGLLLDTGHLNVSAKTLGFDLDLAVKKLAPHVQALHHSDNDGVEDTNHPLSVHYWFLPWMPLYAQATHILEVHDQSIAAIAEQRMLLEKAVS
jgi:sugar phosphate isomerase/epimerase